MADKRIFVEVDEEEASTIARHLRGDTQEAPGRYRLADRFELATIPTNEPVPFLGHAVFIQREMT